MSHQKQIKKNQVEINPFNFGKIRFDVIVGNPPYMATEHMKEFTPLELPIYKSKFDSSCKQFDNNLGVSLRVGLSAKSFYCETAVKRIPLLSLTQTNAQKNKLYA